MFYKLINSAAFPYTYQSHVFCGESEGAPNWFYISGTKNYIQYLVTKLSGYHDIRGQNITIDRLCSSLSVANQLLKHGITMVETMMLNRVGIPKEIKYVTNREVFSTEIYWEEKGKKNPQHLMLSALAKSKRKTSLYWPLLSLFLE